jgi:glycosyltransferase involved in cell wall biosynthesis
MRIAYLGNPNVVHIQRWLREFESRGHVCELFAAAAPETQGSTAHLFGVAGDTGPSSTVVRLLELRDLLRRFRPDVLHAHYALGHGTWAALSGFRPMVVTCMGSDLLLGPKQSWKSRVKVNLALRSANLVTVNAGHLGSAAVRLGASPARVVRVVQGVLPDVYTPVPRLEIPTEPVILSTRHLHPIYRVDDLIRASARLMRRGSRFRLHLAGSGPEEPKLRSLVSRLGLESRVDFLGQIDGEPALAATYRRADIYASVSESDGASVALLEAMACALPIVASDIPANREWLAAGSGNLLVRVGDDTHIAAGLEQLLGSPELRARTGDRNRRLALKSANWSLEMDRMEAHYQRLILTSLPNP